MGESALLRLPQLAASLLSIREGPLSCVTRYQVQIDEGGPASGKLPDKRRYRKFHTGPGRVSGYAATQEQLRIRSLGVKRTCARIFAITDRI